MPGAPAARRATLAAVFAIAGVVVALAIALLATKRNPVLLAANGADESAFVAVIRDRPYCQRGEVVPRGTAAVRLLIGTYGRPGPDLRLELRSPGRGSRTIARGGLSRGWRQGHVAVPVSHVGETTPVTVCVRTARRTPLAVAGQRTLDRRRRLARLEYLGASNESHLSRLSTIADHYGRGKSRWVGSWTLGLTALLTLAGLALSVRRMIAEGQP